MMLGMTECARVCETDWGKLAVWARFAGWLRAALTAHQLAALDHVGVGVVYGNIKAQGLQEDVLVDHQLLCPLQVALYR